MFDQIIERLKKSESYVSMGLGILVVLVVGILIYRNFSQINRPKELVTTQSEEEKKTAENSEAGKTVQTQYTVLKGDDLWVIADKFYKDPYKWTEIAKANNLDNPNIIHPGNVLIIPSVSVVPLAGLPKTGIDHLNPITEETQNITNAITGDTYVVQKGDFLWEIAVRAYGDGFQVNKIIQENNITEPSLIFSGNVLKIPR